MLSAFIIVVLMVIGLFLACGFLFTLFFIWKGIQETDEGAHGSGIGFRFVIIPGCIVFWPVLLKKWLKARKEKPVNGTTS